MPSINGIPSLTSINGISFSQGSGSGSAEYASLAALLADTSQEAGTTGYAPSYNEPLNIRQWDGIAEWIVVCETWDGVTSGQTVADLTTQGAVTNAIIYFSNTDRVYQYDGATWAQIVTQVLSYPLSLDLGASNTAPLTFENQSDSRSACVSDLAVTGAFSVNMASVGPLSPSGDATVTVTATDFGAQLGQLSFRRSDVGGLSFVELLSDREISLLLELAASKGAAHAYDFSPTAFGTDKIGSWPSLSPYGTVTGSSSPGNMPLAGAIGALTTTETLSGAGVLSLATGQFDRSSSRSFVLVVSARSADAPYRRSLLLNAEYNMVGFLAVGVDTDGKPYIYSTNSNEITAKADLNIENQGWGVILVTYNAATTTAVIYAKLVSGASASASAGSVATQSAPGNFALGTRVATILAWPADYAHFSVYDSVLTVTDLDDFVALLS